MPNLIVGIGPGSKNLGFRLGKGSKVGVLVQKWRFQRFPYIKLFPLRSDRLTIHIRNVGLVEIQLAAKFGVFSCLDP